MTLLDSAAPRCLRVGLDLGDDVVGEAEAEAQWRLRELYRVGRRLSGGGGALGGWRAALQVLLLGGGQLMAVSATGDCEPAIRFLRR